MKILEIVNKEASFYDEKGKKNLIRDMSRDNIKEIINIVLLNDVEYDENVDDIANPADKIIYSNILNKIKTLVQQKPTIVGENNKYNELYLKYNLNKEDTKK